MNSLNNIKMTNMDADEYMVTVKSDIYSVLQKYIGKPITMVLKQHFYTDLHQIFIKYKLDDLKFNVDFTDNGKILINPLNNTTMCVFNALNLQQKD